jgi:PEP-CTERM motif-containing protein
MCSRLRALAPLLAAILVVASTFVAAVYVLVFASNGRAARLIGAPPGLTPPAVESTAASTDYNARRAALMARLNQLLLETSPRLIDSSLLGFGADGRAKPFLADTVRHSSVGERSSAGRGTNGHEAGQNQIGQPFAPTESPQSTGHDSNSSGAMASCGSCDGSEAGDLGQGPQDRLRLFAEDFLGSNAVLLENLLPPPLVTPPPHVPDVVLSDDGRSSGKNPTPTSPPEPGTPTETVPEPATVLIFALGLGMMLVAGLRSDRSAARY